MVYSPLYLLTPLPSFSLSLSLSPQATHLYRQMGKHVVDVIHCQGMRVCIVKVQCGERVGRVSEVREREW
jgi:hypothetical protein